MLSINEIFSLPSFLHFAMYCTESIVWERDRKEILIQAHQVLYGVAQPDRINEAPWSRRNYYTGVLDLAYECYA